MIVIRLYDILYVFASLSSLRMTMTVTHPRWKYLYTAFRRRPCPSWPQRPANSSRKHTFYWIASCVSCLELLRWIENWQLHGIVSPRCHSICTPFGGMSWGIKHLWINKTEELAHFPRIMWHICTIPTSLALKRWGQWPKCLPSGSQIISRQLWKEA